MKRNFDDIDPGVRRFFPWALFLVCALLFGLAAHSVSKPTIEDYACYGRDQYQAMWDQKPICKGPSMMNRARDFFEGRTGKLSQGQDVGDPYGCFGGGRYEAMSEGRVCPGFEGK